MIRDEQRDQDQARAVGDATGLIHFLGEPTRARVLGGIETAIRIAREEGWRSGLEGRVECNSDQELTTLHEMIHLEWYRRYPAGDFPQEEKTERRAERRRQVAIAAAKEEGNCVQCDRNGPVGEPCSCGLYFSRKETAP